MVQDIWSKEFHQPRGSLIYQVVSLFILHATFDLLLMFYTAGNSIKIFVDSRNHASCTINKRKYKRIGNKQCRHQKNN